MNFPLILPAASNLGSERAVVTTSFHGEGSFSCELGSTGSCILAQCTTLNIHADKILARVYSVPATLINSKIHRCRSNL